jgi:CO/xanthine dehydrogenase FAD-binding subunit
LTAPLVLTAVKHDQRDAVFLRRECEVRSRFKYLRPGGVGEAVEMQTACGPGGRYLAGGTDLYLDWKNGYPIDCCIDISHLHDLDYLHAQDGTLRIGALTSLRSLEANPGIDYASRALADIARVMCTPQTRTLATVGGNLCNASPAADLTPLLICLDATLTVVGREGQRTFAITDLCSGPKTTTLDPSELVVEIEARLRPRAVAVFRRATRTALDIALVIVSVLVGTDDDQVINAARVGLGSVAPVPLRAEEAETLLLGLPLSDVDSELLQDVAARAADCARPIDDARTSAAYRSDVTATLTYRALSEAIAGLRAKDGAQ